MKIIVQRIVISAFLVLSGIVSFGQENLQPLEKQLINIDKFLNSVFRPNLPGASIIVMKEGKIILNKGYGKASMELGIEMDSSMLFNIGSLSKQFTAVAIMVLVEEGKVRLENTIDQYLEGCPEYYKEITVRQLLNHTSGLRNYTSIPEVRSNLEKSTTIERMLEIIYGYEPDFNPGDKFAYNNSGYILVGKIIESISEMSLEDFITENLFNPSGMENTFFAHDGKIYPGMVMGYEVKGDILSKANYMSMSHTYGGGSVISNTEDLSRWFRALTEGRIINKSNVELCFTRSTLTNGSATDYGLGFYIGGEGPSSHIYHGGGVWGFVAFFMYIPNEDLFVAMLSNMVNFNTANPAGKITSRVAFMSSEKQQEREIISIDPAKLEKYCGDYKMENGTIGRITIIEGKIFFEKHAGDSGKKMPKTELVPGSVSVFYVSGSMSFFRFIFEDIETVKAFEVIQPAGGAKLNAVKLN